MTNMSWTKSALIAALCFFTGSAVAAGGYPGEYRGDFFAITYPVEFTAITINGDEARFVSPDGAVEFYVHAPQWAGHPETYLEIKDTEELVDENTMKSEKEGAYLDYLQSAWVTIRARDGSYLRSYVHRRACHTSAFIDCESHIFGIKYRDDEAYAQYSDVYKAFKFTLVQFAD